MKCEMRKCMAMILTAVTAATAGAALSAMWEPLAVYASDKAVDTVYLGTSRHVWWETDTLGKWSSISKAHEYQVKLYIADYVDRDEENWRKIDFDDESMDEAECVLSKRTSETSFDFSEYMSDLHSYFFVVRATPKISEQAYVVAGDWVASMNVDFRGTTVQGITEGKWRNYLEGSKYEDGDGNFLTEGWQLIKGNWYLLDAGGYRLMGWQERDGKRYYLSDTDGRLTTGWIVWNDAWYYMGKDGSMQTGWVMVLPGQYYYLNEDGTMAHDTEIDGYVLGSDGLRQ